MPRWVSCAKYGVVVNNFKPKDKRQLKVEVGDTVHIVEEYGDWYRGYLTKNRHVKGIFPQSLVHIKDVTVTRMGAYESLTLKDLPIVQEMTSVLREWGVIWRNLYISRNPDYVRVSQMMLDLIDARRQIMSSKLTTEQLKELQQKATAKIDMGNTILELDLVVRDEDGDILKPEETGTIRVFRQHELATQRIKRESESQHEESKVLGARGKTYKSGRHTLNLFVIVRNFVCRIGEDADVLMTLYDGKAGRFFSENYVVKWGNRGMPKDLEMLNNLQVLFTDLGSKDLLRDKVVLVCQIIRVGGMHINYSDSKKASTNIRRPFGVAAMDLTDIFKGQVEPDIDKQFFIPFLQCSERDFMDSVVRRAISSNNINSRGQGLWVSLRMLYGDMKQCREENPHLVVGTTAVARKMGFPEVILPGDIRNDIYITLQQGEFSIRSKTSAPNVEVTMCVCNGKGQVIENVITQGSGADMYSQYKSVVYYHEDKPKWFETVKVAVPIEAFYDCHLKFTFKHRCTTEGKDKYERPFAMAYVNLMCDNGTTLLDKVHDMLVYKTKDATNATTFSSYVTNKFGKIDSKKQEDASIYLKLPSTRSDLDPSVPFHKQSITSSPPVLTLSTKDFFSISTLVCSTKLTHNVDLLGLLKWRDNPSGLKQNLIALMKVDGEEVVKFLQDTLDALFLILVSHQDTDTYDNLVFEALIFIISLIADRKYHQFRPVLNAYIQTDFSATLAYNKLMVVLKDYIDRANENQETLLRAMKSIEFIFKFIIRSRMLFASLYDNRGKQQFEISLKQLFQAINGMMMYSTDYTVLVQGAALKYLPACIEDIMAVFDPKDLSFLLVEFINNVPRDRLTKQKMSCVDDILKSNLFKLAECRRILLPMIMGHVKSLLEAQEEYENCVEILSDTMELLHQQGLNVTSEDISMVTRAILRTVIQTVIAMDRESGLIGKYVAVMIALLRQMSEHHYQQYISHFANKIDLLDFQMEILMVFRDLVEKNVYPSDWNEMIMLQCSVFLKALRYFSHTIRDKFSHPFEYQLWNNFFHCAISFLTQKPLQLESFSHTKRNKIISRYKDMRRETGFEIRSMWFNLGQHKIRFIPSMVGPILEMTLIPETELRKATIPIFFDMMQCEFNQVLPGHRHKIRGNFQQVENEIITQLDALVEGGRGNEQYKDLFYEIMCGLCQGHSTMQDQGLKFVEIVQMLLQRLLEYRTIINDENKENRMSCTVNLLNYYHAIDRQEMYIRYLHKLCDLHLDWDNYTEAAYTLMLYARLLRWSDEPLPQIMLSDKYPEARTHWGLKEKLYYDIIDYFDKGEMWEKAIELCKELVKQYEDESFDYISLSSLLTRMASYYDRVMMRVRPEPEYFRVSYCGKGFPSFLQNQMFIYRGKAYERLSDFNARLQNQFSNAQFLRTLSPPGDDIKNSSGQFLQVNAVTPVFQPNHRFHNKSVSDQILKYYKMNEVQRFRFSRPVTDNKNDVTNMWLERTIVVTSYPLPGILRWFPVSSTETYLVSPLENALETMESKNKRLEELIEQHSNDMSMRVDTLSMELQGVVDAAVNGGIALFKVFYEEQYLIDNPDAKNQALVLKLKDATKHQLAILTHGLGIHGQKAPDTLQPFHMHMEERFEQMRKNIEEEYNIKVPPNTPTRVTTARVKRVQTMPSQPRAQTLMAPSEAPPVGEPAEPERPTYATPAAVLASAQVNRSQSVFIKNVPSPSKTLTTPSKSKSSSNSRIASFASLLSESSSSSSDRNSREGPLIEISQELRPARPPRPDSDARRSRSMSGTFNKSNTSLNKFSVSGEIPINDIDADINSNSEVPPPLPDKLATADYSNLDDMEAAPPLKARSFSQRSHKDKPAPPLPVAQASEEGPPPPPPRKTSRPSMAI